MSLRLPEASHTIVWFMMRTGMSTSDSPGGTMPSATNPSLENEVVFPRSLIVMGGHGWD